MALPLSLQSNFFSLGKYFFQTILKDDFPHKKFETETFKATTKNNNAINYKTECQRAIKNGQSTFTLKDELKFGYKPFGQSYLQTRVKRDGEIRYHLDLGKFKIKNLERNVFAALKTDMNLEKFWVRFGIAQQGKNFQSLQRVEKNYQGQYQMSLSGIYWAKPFSVSAGIIKNIVNNQLNKFDTSINFNKNGLDLTLQHISIPNTKKQFPLGKILCAIAYEFNKKYQFGAWFKKNLQNQKQRCVYGIQCKPNDKLMIKAKADCKGKTSFSSKFKLTNSIICNLGTQINVISLCKDFDLKKIMQIPFGYSLEINL